MGEWPDNVRRRRRTVMVLLMGAGVVTVLAVLGQRAIVTMRERARDSICCSRLTQVAWALRSYHEGFGAFPPAYVGDGSSGPKTSWRVLLGAHQGFQEAKDVYLKYKQDERWDSPHNRSLADKRWGEFYACPSDFEAMRLRQTSFVAVIGEYTMWPKGSSRSLNDLDVTDGDKILLIELPQSDIHWLEPRDVTLAQALALFDHPKGLRSARHPHGLHYVTTRGEVRDLSSIETAGQFGILLQIRGESKVR